MDKTLFRDGMSRVASAVHVIARHGSGCTASAVTSITDDPPTMMVCLNRNTQLGEEIAHRALEGTGPFSYPDHFSINTLGCCDEAVGKTFAGMTGVKGAARFLTGDWDMDGEAPRLRTAMSSFLLKVTEVRLISTHYAIMGEVIEVRVSDGEHLVYANRQFVRVAA